MRVSLSYDPIKNRSLLFFMQFMEYSLSKGRG